MCHRAGLALSLDFFLTRPYLRLAIEDKHDVIAFAGLAVCGLIVASLARDRRPSELRRPDPDALLRRLAADADARGRLKVFFGASPGVGQDLRDARGGPRAARPRASTS